MKRVVHKTGKWTYYGCVEVPLCFGPKRKFLNSLNFDCDDLWKYVNCKRCIKMWKKKNEKNP